MTNTEIYLKRKSIPGVVEAADKYREDVKNKRIKIAFRLEKPCESFCHGENKKIVSNKTGDVFYVAGSFDAFEETLMGHPDEKLDGLVNIIGHYALDFGDTGYFFTYKNDPYTEEIEKFYIRN